jgi:hypothetical protein
MKGDGMSMKSGLIVGALIVLCLAVILVSSLATDQLTRAFEAFPRRFSEGPQAFGPPFGLGILGRFGPFGRHLGGWRGIASSVGSFFFLYLASALALLAFPRPLRAMRDAFRSGAAQWLRLLAIGVLTALGFLLLTALGLLTSAVFPVPFLLVPVLLVMLWGGLVGLALALGRAIQGAAGMTRASPLAELALGSLVVFALGRIPVAGWVLTLLLAAPALGAVVATRFGTGGSWSLAAFEETE